jgi:transketolase C-terminal domain/subunit
VKSNGKAQIIREGKDALIISTGFMTMRALDAAVKLEANGVEAAVLHVPTIKPLDTETILAEARKGGRLVVTAENHTVVGGLGEAVGAEKAAIVIPIDPFQGLPTPCVSVVVRRSIFPLFLRWAG